MATVTKDQAYAIVQEEDLDELQALRKDLQARIDEAHSNGRVYMMNQYNTILKKVVSEIKKVRDRFDRETLAGNTRAHKELKLNARGEEEE